MLICTWTHAVFCNIDLQETYEMFDYFWNIVPEVESGERSLFKFQKNEDDELELVEGGMTRAWKLNILFTIILPKAFIALFLLVIGCMYLAASQSNADLFLNCLALVFVLDIDEMIFNFFARKRSVALMDEIPALKAHGKQARGKCRRWCTMLSPAIKYVSSILILVIVALFQPRCGALNGLGGEMGFAGMQSQAEHQADFEERNGLPPREGSANFGRVTTTVSSMTSLVTTSAPTSLVTSLVTVSSTPPVSSTLALQQQQQQLAAAQQQQQLAAAQQQQQQR